MYIKSDSQFLEEAGELTHLIGVLTTEKTNNQNLDPLAMQAQSWAVFPNEGPFPFTLQNIMARIYSEWLLTSDDELAQSLSFSFTRRDKENPDDAYSEIWIPVGKRKTEETR